MREKRLVCNSVEAAVKQFSGNGRPQFKKLIEMR